MPKCTDPFCAWVADSVHDISGQWPTCRHDSAFRSFLASLTDEIREHNLIDISELRAFPLLQHMTGLSKKHGLSMTYARLERSVYKSRS